jgi:ferric-dicitrate binding protein FerR (iron transport regulator)
MSTQEIPTREPSPDAQRLGGPGGLEADGLGSYPAPPGRRRGRRLLAGVLAVAVLGGAGWWAGGHPGLDRGTHAATPAAPTATATVARQDLNGQTKVSGTLGYAGSATVQSPLSGRITWLPRPGR